MDITVGADAWHMRVVENICPGASIREIEGVLECLRELEGIAEALDDAVRDGGTDLGSARAVPLRAWRLSDLHSATRSRCCCDRPTLVVLPKGSKHPLTCGNVVACAARRLAEDTRFELVRGCPSTLSKSFDLCSAGFRRGVRSLAGTSAERW
jgi:hypothetical protein